MLTRYSAWANVRLYAALAQVPATWLTDARPGRPHGVNGILSHNYVVDLIWRAHLEDTEHGFTSRNFLTVPSFEELHTAQQQSDQWYIDYADIQEEPSLEQIIPFKFVDGGSGKMSRGDMLLHIINHKTYHRGYIADMLYEYGSAPPTMDLPVFLRDELPEL
ncbi:DinB family protein [Nitrincola sp. MINF-07-Sa-05]|uniref:DinB family protein n=1 Tax=Nitrincola salilacus TaxID=3400273 RepID=UPI0039182037